MQEVEYCEGDDVEHQRGEYQQSALVLADVQDAASAEDLLLVLLREK